MRGPIHFAVHRPAAALALLIGVTGVLTLGLPQLRAEYGYRVLLGDDHPAIHALDETIDTFGGGLPLTIAWACEAASPCEAVHDDESLRMADAITRTLAGSPHVLRVQGIANAPLLVPLTDGFATRRLFEAGAPAPDAAALALRARDDPIWRDRLISQDGRAAAIVLQPRDTRSATDIAMVDSLRRVLAPYEDAGMEFHLVGDAVATVVSGRALAESTARLVPFTVVVIAAIVFLFVRSWAGTLLCLASLGVALLWSFGLLGWLAWPQDGILEVLAPLVLVIGVCDAIHLLAVYASALAKVDAESLSARRAAMQRAAEEVIAPCSVTTLTTALAFLSFLTSDLDTFVRFGSISAFASVACFVTTFSLLPALGPRVALPRSIAERRSAAWNAAMRGIARTARARRTALLSATLLLFGFFALGAARLEVDTNWYESWGARSDVVRWLRFVESRLGPSETLEIAIALPDGAPLEEPETLARVEALANALSEIDGLGAPRSILAPLARLHRLVRDDDPAFERLPDAPQGNAELLELLEFEGVEHVAPWLTLDRRRLRISLAAQEQPYSERRRTLEAVAATIESSTPRDWQVTVSGETAIGFQWIRDVQSTQLRSFPMALALALIAVALLFRSLRTATAALVPTLLPIAVTLGAMGWLGTSLDVGRAMLAAVILGIAIDDAIHFLHRLRTERRREEKDAIARTLVAVGPALVTTSAALSLGFLTFMASAWQTISSFGFFMSLAIAGALLATLFVLPALLYVAASTRASRATG